MNMPVFGIYMISLWSGIQTFLGLVDGESGKRSETGEHEYQGEQVEHVLPCQLPRGRMMNPNGVREHEAAVVFLHRMSMWPASTPFRGGNN